MRAVPLSITTHACLPKSTAVRNYPIHQVQTESHHKTPPSHHAAKRLYTQKTVKATHGYCRYMQRNPPI